MYDWKKWQVPVVGSVFIPVILLLVAVAVLLAAPSTASAGRPIGTAFPIRAEAQVELDPAIAYNSQWQEYLVVFWNDRPGNDDIRAERVSKDGELLGGKWIAAGPGAERRHPDVAYNSKLNQYLIVWEEESGPYKMIRSQRFSADLTAQSEGVQTIVSATWPHNARVAYAYTPNKYLVVWQEDSNLAGSSHIYGHIVSSNGISTFTGDITISYDWGGERREYPDVAYNRHANGFLVVWQQYHLATAADPRTAWDIWSCLVNGDGPPPSFSPRRIIAADSNKPSHYPAVAAIPTAPSPYKFLVVWNSHNYQDLNYVVGRLVAEDGTPSASYIHVDTTSTTKGAPTVAGTENGDYYLVAFARGSVYDPFSWRIVGREVSYGGQFLNDGTQFGIPAAWNPSVAAGPSGDFLMASQGHTDTLADYNIYGQVWGYRMPRVYIPLTWR